MKTAMADPELHSLGYPFEVTQAIDSITGKRS